MVVVAAGLVLAALPLFMVGGLAVQIKDELEFSEAVLGAAVTIGFITGALTAPFGGRLADHIGARRAVYIGSSLSVVALVGLGLFSFGWWPVVAFLCVAGLGVAVIDPGLAILVDRVIPTERQGLAFGIKEASIPASTLAAGIAVPAIALTVGWRWAFAVGLLPWLAIVVLLPRLRARATTTQHASLATHTGPGTTPRRGAMILLMVAAALGTAAASGIGIFLTDSAVSMGVSEAGAGLLLATGSVAGIISRVGTGVLADRIGGPQFKLIALMVAIGAVTMVAGASGSIPLLVVGTVGTFAAGWSWTGLYFLSLMRTSPAKPGAVVGLGIAGLGMGNALGPLGFGVLAESFSFETAWVGASIVAAVSALLMAVCHRTFSGHSRTAI